MISLHMGNQKNEPRSLFDGLIHNPKPHINKMILFGWLTTNAFDPWYQKSSKHQHYFLVAFEPHMSM